ncbi:glycoside hydrolase family 97 C-terminal domain-containing protein [Actinopolymorpha sp. B11F2]|uniref:glycoside hydrolase family 97 C-terminal domain-containing protein n=1 Tax=Actinopolymorpha sp. B11F2 TaxID=3160862 RepID=UPI0032E45FD4
MWNDTRLLSGRPGDHVVMARRSGARWFLGAGVSGPGRTLAVPLDLPPGRWHVDVIRDGEAGLVREQQVVDAGSTFTVDVAADGGFAAVVCLTGETTCY